MAGDCVLWTGRVRPDGYGYKWTPMVDGKRKSMLAHRYVMAQHAGWDAIEGKQVNHHCDNPRCVNPDHLYIGTQIDNITDMHARGRNGHGAPRGSAHHRTHLDDDDVREIRRLYAEQTGILQREIAAQFGVSQAQVSAIIRRAFWRHL